MRAAGGRRWRAVMGLALCLPLVAVLGVSASPARAAVTRAEVGFWAGEPVVNPDNLGADPSYYLPREISELTPAVWGVLHASHTPLYLNLRYGRDFGPTPLGSPGPAAALRLVRTANGLGVPLVAWILIPTAQGYWADKLDEPLVTAAVNSWLSWTRSNHLAFRQVVLDQEMPYQMTAAFEADLVDPPALAQLMLSNINPPAQCAAMVGYRDLVSSIHAQGVSIANTMVPYAVDDLADGSTALADSLDMSAFPPLGFDDYYVQAYRTFADSSFGLDLGSAWVASYFESMRHYFGRTGQVTIGIAGDPPYNSLSTLEGDVRMLAAMGATEIPIYDLETTLSRFGVQGLQALINAGHQPLGLAALAQAVAPTALSIGGRALFNGLDTLADALTPIATAKTGHVEHPNAFPGGCGNPHPGPLAHPTG